LQSLLWPSGPPPAHGPEVLPAQALVDLELDPLLEALAAARPERRHAARELLMRLPLDPRVSRHRAAVVADLLASPRLCDRLDGVQRLLARLAAHRPQVFPRDTPRATRVGARVVELETYVEAVEALSAALRDEAVRSDGLRALRQEAEALAGEEAFVALRSELPRWRRALGEVRSVLVSIEVSPALEPEAAVLLDFSSEPPPPQSFALRRLLGEDTGRRGRVRLFRRQPVDWQGSGQLAAEVRQLLEAVAAPLEHALHSYRLVRAQALAPLEDELILLLGAAALARRWSGAGLPVCLAEVLPPRPPAAPGPGGPTGPGCAAAADADGEWWAEEAYHPVLAMRLPAPAAVVRNRIAFGDGGALWILTGPNRGGKTTYLRAAGVVQVLAQAGLPVPAARARVQAVDRVFTHFPAAEAAVPGMGRLDEEAQRVAEVFASGTGASLVLLNEVLASTSAPEALALAADVLRGMRVLGLRGIYATHLHELAGRCEEINASVPGRSRVAPLTVEAVTDPDVPGHGAAMRRPTYRVVPGPPDGASFFASAIARQHGISLPQILERLKTRGLLPDREGPGGDAAPGAMPAP
jgi:DNA mismatch repair protein MutS